MVNRKAMEGTAFWPTTDGGVPNISAGDSTA